MVRDVDLADDGCPASKAQEIFVLNSTVSLNPVDLEPAPDCPGIPFVACEEDCHFCLSPETD